MNFFRRWPHYPKMGKERLRLGRSRKWTLAAKGFDNLVQDNAVWMRDNGRAWRNHAGFFQRPSEEVKQNIFPLLKGVGLVRLCSRSLARNTGVIMTETWTMIEEFWPCDQLCRQTCTAALRRWHTWRCWRYSDGEVGKISIDVEG